MSAAPKGKVGTKGAKQIVEGNKATLAFYRNMALGSTAICVLLHFALFETTKLQIFMISLCCLIMLAAYQFMLFMSRAQYSEAGTLLDAGNDLNMSGGIGENVKDLIILPTGTMLLALVSNYFWFLLLFAPLHAGWMLWDKVIRAWLAQSNEKEEPETDDKKKKKLERRMKRMQR